MLAAVVSWCLYSVLLKKIDSSKSQLASLEVIIIIGLIFIFPFYLIESFNSSFLPSKNVDFVIIIYVAFFASILAFFSWNKGVSIIGPNRASLFLHLIPIFSSLWALLFLNDGNEVGYPVATTIKVDYPNTFNLRANGIVASTGLEPFVGLDTSGQEIIRIRSAILLDDSSTYPSYTTDTDLSGVQKGFVADPGFKFIAPV